MRILISGNINYYSFNGQTIFMKNLAEGLARRGNQVMLLVPSHDGKARQFEQNGVILQMTPSFRLTFLHPDAVVSLFSEKIVRRVIDSFKPDIIHLHDHYPLSVEVYRYARKKHLKVVGTNHFMPENLAPHLRLIAHYKSAFEWSMWRWMLSLFNHLDAVTAPSRTAVNILRKNGLRTPVCPISNGVDMHKFHLIPNFDKNTWRKRYGFATESALFLYVGRIDGEKHIDILLKALADLKRKDIQLGIVGRGTDTRRLKAMAAALHLDDRQVHFTGFVADEDLPYILNSADVFAMPSEAELQSIATLEAMACGRPVLAANSQALPELVTHGLNGFLFNPGDHENAAHWMAEMLDGPLTLTEMSKASLNKVEIHSIENSLFSYEKLFEKAMNGSPIPQITGSPKVALNKAKSQP